MRQLIFQNKIIPDIQIAKFDLAKAEKELAISESDLKTNCFFIFRKILYR